MIRAATIMKSVEPPLTIGEEAERRNAKLLGDAKMLNLQKMVLEDEKADAIRAKQKAEEDLKALEAKLETLEREKGAEIVRLQRREEEFLAKVEKFRGLAAEEKVRADLVEKQCEDLAEDAKSAVAATEGALKAQLAILVPDFNTDQIGFFKDIVDECGFELVSWNRVWRIKSECRKYGREKSFDTKGLIKTFRPPGVRYLG
ncbi:hypothetical protein PIB30_065432 [Stylosanthes scabra]|uniref:Uncharacterized protein n=1 Tax=Stylosanthes scabra TaxID=79078 RepID=A0ABU6SLZ9_9FABA|nr:hypothetical protein [Stylosanthes scabra]